jgi:transposase
MESKRIILTRKIQLLIDCDEQEKRRAYYQQLYDWQRMCFRGANYIYTNHYLQDQIKEILYITDEVKVKLADVNKDAEGILNTSRMNTTYRLLSNYFKGQMPSDIYSNLNNTLVNVYNTERSAYWKGEKSLRNYKRNIPIPFSAKLIKLMNDEKGRNYKFTLFKIPFKTYLGKDRSDKKVLLQRTSAGTIKLCSCSLKIDKGKIFLLAAFEMERDQHSLDDTIIAEASLSIEHPIAVKVGKETTQIGNKEEFLHRRLAIQAARHRLQRGSTYNRAGKGRKRKLKSLDDYSEKEKRYVDNRLHLYSRRLIDFCIKNQAGTLLLVNQEQKEEVAKEEEFLLRNWSYYGLKEKIAYKANKAGINLIVE